jgi:hypothetical protein
MTRFDYFSDIEDHFVRLRGKSLFLDSLDWELIEQWKTAGVPLHIVISAIEEVFEKNRARANRRAIGTLRYCKPEVEARFAEYKESRVGAHESEPGAVHPVEIEKRISRGKATGSTDPFPKDEVLAHLERKRDELAHLIAIANDTEPATPDGLLFGLAHVIEKLSGLRTGLQVAERIDARLLEVGLTELELILDTAIAAAATTGQLMDAEMRAIEVFSPYQGNMLPQVYEQQIDNALKKNLRAAFGVPRLSLFHMKG